MTPGADDTDYLSAFDTRVLPVLDTYRPEALLISAASMRITRTRWQRFSSARSATSR
jgi:hypothetical protein